MGLKLTSKLRVARAEKHLSQAELAELAVAGVAGLEPVTSAVTGQRSNQLSYTPAREPVNLGKLPGQGGVNAEVRKG
jgi:hypothetical protein